MTFTLQPRQEVSDDGCWVSLDYIGLLSNGINVFGWGDGHSYQNQNTWFQLAPVFEYYDMDLCFGHAAKSKYHHHNFPNCLAENLNDNGTSHSPIYGFAADGFPIYGPWQAKDTLAKSCWALRDYSSNSKTGCSDNERSCILKNEYDYREGVISAPNRGPLFNETVETLSNNKILATNGVYYQDYYYDTTCSGDDDHLNEFNGHDHDDLGFHYHFTIDEHFLPTFPYSVGPKFFGSLPDTSHCCSTFLDAVSLGFGPQAPPPPPCETPPCPLPPGPPPCETPPCPGPQPSKGCTGKSIGSEYTYGVSQKDAKCL